MQTRYSVGSASGRRPASAYRAPAAKYGCGGRGRDPLHGSGSKSRRGRAGADRSDSAPRQRGVPSGRCIGTRATPRPVRPRRMRRPRESKALCADVVSSVSVCFVITSLSTSFVDSLCCCPSFVSCRFSVLAALRRPVSRGVLAFVPVTPGSIPPIGVSRPTRWRHVVPCRHRSRTVRQAALRHLRPRTLCSAIR